MMAGEISHMRPDTRARDDTGCGLVWVPGRTFTMGSNEHYPEEAPAHRVSVDGFWIDPTPVTYRQFASFVKDTGHVTVAEKTPDAADYPGSLPKMLRAGSLVFTQPKSVAGPDITQWWSFKFGADWRHPYGGRSDIRGKLDHPVVHVAYNDARAYADWAGKDLPTEAEWELAARGGLDDVEYAWGDELSPDGRLMANTWQGIFPTRSTKTRGRGQNVTSRIIPSQRLRHPRHDRERLGMDIRLLVGQASRACGEVLLHPSESAWWRTGNKLRPSAARNPNSKTRPQGWIASLRAELLPSLSSRSQTR
jgi:sulfatase modifying factor 1